MGFLLDGSWQKDGHFPTAEDGSFVRKPSTFRADIAENEQFAPESQRYHLYVSLACPWAHRTLIMHALKGLGAHIGVSVVDPDMLTYGWTFSQDKPGCTGDQLYQLNYLYQLYLRADPTLTSRVTVPVLWDTHLKTIVNNESSDIIRIFNRSFNALTANTEDYYPPTLREAIDAWNTHIYQAVNNGVYACGFATTQSAYDHAIKRLFDTLDSLEQHLQSHDWLVGNQLTEADIRLIPTLLRFDPVYVTHFKCNRKRIIDYPALHAYLERLYAIDAIRKTTNIAHIKRHYYYSHQHINPYRIIAAGPDQF